MQSGPENLDFEKDFQVIVQEYEEKNNQIKKAAKANNEISKEVNEEILQSMEELQSSTDNIFAKCNELTDLMKENKKHQKEIEETLIQMLKKMPHLNNESALGEFNTEFEAKSIKLKEQQNQIQQKIDLKLNELNELREAFDLKYKALKVLFEKKKSKMEDFLNVINSSTENYAVGIQAIFDKYDELQEQIKIPVVVSMADVLEKSATLTSQYNEQSKQELDKDKKRMREEQNQDLEESQEKKQKAENSSNSTNDNEINYMGLKKGFLNL